MTEFKETVSICMPVLNEIDVIQFVVEEWLEVVKHLPSGSHIFIEDGGSTDGTREYLNETLKENPTLIKVSWREKPEGFGVAALRLLKSAEGDWVFFTDSDGQYVASDFWLLWERRTAVDFVRGVKLGRQDPPLRRITSLVWNKSVKFLFELPVSDINAAYLLIRGTFLKRILVNVRILPTMILSEIVIRSVLANANFGKDVYVMHRIRKSGASRATPTQKLFRVGVNQIIGLFRLKQDYRVASKKINI